MADRFLQTLKDDLKGLSPAERIARSQHWIDDLSKGLWQRLPGLGAGLFMRWDDGVPACESPRTIELAGRPWIIQRLDDNGEAAASRLRQRIASGVAAPAENEKGSWGQPWIDLGKCGGPAGIWLLAEYDARVTDAGSNAANLSVQILGELAAPFGVERQGAPSSWPWNLPPAPYRNALVNGDDWIRWQGDRLGMFVGVHYLREPDNVGYKTLPVETDDDYRLRFPVLYRGSKWGQLPDDKAELLFKLFAYQRDVGTLEFLDVCRTPARRSSLEHRLNVLFCEPGEVMSFLFEQSVLGCVEGTSTESDREQACRKEVRESAVSLSLADDDTQVATPRLRRMADWLTRHADSATLAQSAGFSPHHSPTLPELRDRFLSGGKTWFNYLSPSTLDALFRCSRQDQMPATEVLTPLARDIINSGHTLAGLKGVVRFNLDGHRLMRQPKFSDHGEAKSVLGFPLAHSGTDGHFFIGTFADLDALYQLSPQLFESRVTSIVSVLTMAAADSIMASEATLRGTMRAASVGEFKVNSGRTGKSAGIDRIVGNSPAIRKVKEKILKHATYPFGTVHLHGESGSGKDLVARGLHEASSRHDKPFVPVNCGVLRPEHAESVLFGHRKGAYTGADLDRLGEFQNADGGTLFLDEIADLPLDTQVMLNRVLNEPRNMYVTPMKGRPVKVDVWVITATHKDLGKLTVATRFREDLFGRLRKPLIAVPSLAERMEDIPLIVNHLWRNRAKLAGVWVTKNPEPRTIARLQGLSWPTNVRQLVDLVEVAFIEMNDGDLDTAFNVAIDEEEADTTRLPTAETPATSPVPRGAPTVRSWAKMGVEEKFRAMEDARTKGIKWTNFKKIYSCDRTTPKKFAKHEFANSPELIQRFPLTYLYACSQDDQDD